MYRKPTPSAAVKQTESLRARHRRRRSIFAIRYQRSGTQASIQAYPWQVEVSGENPQTLELEENFGYNPQNSLAHFARVTKSQLAA
jgi:hypothetical protein